MIINGAGQELNCNGYSYLQCRPRTTLHQTIGECSASGSTAGPLVIMRLNILKTAGVVG